MSKEKISSSSVRTEGDFGFFSSIFSNILRFRLVGATPVAVEVKDMVFLFWLFFNFFSTGAPGKVIGPLVLVFRFWENGLTLVGEKGGWEKSQGIWGIFISGVWTCRRETEIDKREKK